MNSDFFNKSLSLSPAATSASDDSKSSGTSSRLGQSSSGYNAPISPYLNYDPRLLQAVKPEFIFPEGATKQRGRFELAFSQIGTSVMLGAGIGGMAGFYNGIKITKRLQQNNKFWKTQMLNHVMKQGSATANTLGTFAIMYSALGVLLQNLRGEDDSLNTVLAGTTTGVLYKSTAGLKKCLLGGTVGLCLTSIYCLIQFARMNSTGNTNMKFL